MDAVLCLRQATHFQSMELERPEAICGLESGTRSRLWSTRGDCACRQEVAFFGLRLAGTEITCLTSRSSAKIRCSAVMPNSKRRQSQTPVLGFWLEWILPTVADLMGHLNMQMTMRYAHLAPAHKAAAVERLSMLTRSKGSAKLLYCFPL